VRATCKKLKRIIDESSRLWINSSVISKRGKINVCALNVVNRVCSGTEGDCYYAISRGGGNELDPGSKNMKFALKVSRKFEVREHKNWFTFHSGYHLLLTHQINHSLCFSVLETEFLIYIRAIL
jgi:hypothetical protein